MNGNIKPVEKVKRKVVVKEWVEDPLITEYKKSRDRHLYKIFLKNNDQDAINFLKHKYGF